MGGIDDAHEYGVPILPCAYIDRAGPIDSQSNHGVSPNYVLCANTSQNSCQSTSHIDQIYRRWERPHDDSLGAVVDTQNGHGDFLTRCRRLRPEILVWESLRCAPEDFWWEAELGLVVAIGVEARWDVGEVVGAGAVVAAAAAVGGVADCAEKEKGRGS